MSIKIKQQGFSLIEIALTILLISILLAGSLTLTGAFRDMDKREQVVEQLADISKAMNMYLAVNKHLPCPDISGNGREDRHSNGVNCLSDIGGLPYVDLAVARRDAWGNVFAYKLNDKVNIATYSYITDICEPASVFAKTGALTIPVGFEYCPESATYFCGGGCTDACGVGNCVIRDPRQPYTPPFFHFATQPIGATINFDTQNDNKGSLILVSATDEVIANSIVAMVISYGENAYKFWDRNRDREIDSANCSTAAGLTPIEVENCDITNNKFKQAQIGEELNFFTWMTLNEAKQIMIQTGGFSE